MFINKWLITESFGNNKQKDKEAGLCLYFNKEPDDISELYKYLQNQPENSFALYLSGQDISLEKISESYIEKIISIFFQPCYYFFNYQPLLFLTDNTPASLNFCNRLGNKCRKQGFQISIVEVKNDPAGAMTNQPAYQLTTATINYSLVLKKWVSLYLENRNPGEIHLLISEKLPDPIQVLDKIGESDFKGTEEYKIANRFYENQKLINEYKHELDLRINNEKDARLYLKIQKEQTQNNVEWYHCEYEILPGWYKKLGHLIKALMGKRSFRSLFNDNIKK